MKPLKVLMMAALTTIAIPVFAQNSTGKASAEPSKKVKYNTSEHGEAMLQKTGTPPACMNDKISQRANENEYNEDLYGCNGA